MADPPDSPDFKPHTRPRWVKVLGIVAIVLVAVVGVVGIVTLVAGVEHGPGMHAPAGNADDHEGNTPPIDGAPELPVTADELAFAPDRIELPAGMPVNVALNSADELHDLVVDEIDFHLAADRGETAFGGLVFLEPGTYVGYCSVPGHREAGMEFEIVVTPSDGGHAPPPGVEHP